MRNWRRRLVRGDSGAGLACTAMDRLTDDDARARLGLPMAYVLPAAEVLVAEARRIVETNLALARTPSRMMSPIWERKGSRAAVRAVQLPGEFARRYFTGGGRMVLGKAGVRTLVAELMPWMAEDPRGAAAALEDTLELWTFEDEPLELLESPYGGH